MGKNVATDDYHRARLKVSAKSRFFFGLFSVVGKAETIKKAACFQNIKYIQLIAMKAGFWPGKLQIKAVI